MLRILNIILYNVIVTNCFRADVDDIRGLNTLIILIPLNYKIHKKDVRNKCIYMYHVNNVKCNGSNYQVQVHISNRLEIS